MNRLLHLAVTLVLVILFLVGSALSSTEQSKIIVVHTGETKVLHYNPETHKEVHHEMADGNVMLSVQPKEK